MSPELDKKLCEKYPKIFINRNAPMETTAMCWGFECSDGWYDLLDNMCFCIQNHIDYKSKRGTPITQVIADQVKEKFGELRFYSSGGDDYTEGAIDLATNLSTKICEECGDKGELNGKNWIRTTCEKHK